MNRKLRLSPFLKLRYAAKLFLSWILSTPSETPVAVVRFFVSCCYLFLCMSSSSSINSATVGRDIVSQHQGKAVGDRIAVVDE